MAILELGSTYTAKRILGYLHELNRTNQKKYKKHLTLIEWFGVEKKSKHVLFFCFFMVNDEYLIYYAEAKWYTRNYIENASKYVQNIITKKIILQVLIETITNISCSLWKSQIIELDSTDYKTEQKLESGTQMICWRKQLGEIMVVIKMFGIYLWKRLCNFCS